MRYAGNSHPEWGYLAPAPSFLRTARIVIVATAVGATAGAGVVFALVDRPAAESSVAARTLVPPTAAAPISAGAPAQLAPQLAQISDQPTKPVAGAEGGASSASEASPRSTARLPAGAAALAEAPAATDAQEPIRDQAAAATDVPPAPKKPTKKRRSTSPYAWRGEPLPLHRLFDLAPNNWRWANDGNARGRRDGYYPAQDW